MTATMSHTWHAVRAAELEAGDVILTPAGPAVVLAWTWRADTDVTVVRVRHLPDSIRAGVLELIPAAITEWMYRREPLG